MKTCLLMLSALMLFTLLFTAPSRAQNAAPTNCGINSALSLAQTLGSTIDARAELQAKYPTATVSLLDVKQMCQQLGIKTSGVRATLAELLQSATPCIVGLKDPAHFLVLLDGTLKEVRVLDGESAALQIIPLHDLEARYSGLALMPEFAPAAKVPSIAMPQVDRYMAFSGIGQKVDYHFPVSNMGKAPLSLQIVGTSCGCTAAVLKGVDAKRMTLAPGQSSEVIVSYQVQTQALIQQTATLQTNDPRHRQVYLSVRGQLPPQLTLSPPALYVQQNQGEEPDKSFKVIGPPGTAVARVWSDLPYLQFKVGTQQQDGERVIWPVGVQGFPQAPIGAINGKVFVRLQNGTEMFVQVRGEIDAPALPGAREAAQLPRAEDDLTVPMGSPLPTVKVGERAPDFTATDANGRTWHLSALRGSKAVLLTFFPKCFTGGCANHLSSLRDHQTEFDAAAIQILAVSVDTAAGLQGQQAFARQWHFTFPLIPDTQRALCKLCGATQNDDERAARMTFLIDKQGMVRYIDKQVNVLTHGTDMLVKLRELGLAK